MSYRAAVFDLDGTILESSKGDLSWLHNAVLKVLSDRGLEGDYSNRELEALAGLSSKSAFADKCAELGVDSDTFWSEVEEARATSKLKVIEQGQISLCKGVEDLLHHLKTEGIRCGLISNSPDPSVNLILHHFDLHQYFHFYRGVTGLKDFAKKKPNPDHLEMAKTEIGRSPCVYIGDSSSDMMAAERAGMDSIKVPENSNMMNIKDRLW